MNKKADIIHSKNQMLLLVLMLLFLIGELTGTLIFSIVSSGKWTGLSDLIEVFFYNRLECTFIQTVINSFSGTFILLVICAVLGLGIFFYPVEFAIPVFYGLGQGVLLAELYYGCGIKGLLCSLILIIPYTIISAFVINVSAREAILMSKALSENVIYNSTCNKVDLNLYITKYIILIIIVSVASFTDSMITYFGAELWTGLLNL